MERTFALKGNLIFTPACGRLEVRPGQYLVCEDGLVAGIFETLPERFGGIPVHDHGDRLILPGLVDLHVHASQYAYQGLGMDMELLDWLEENAFPEEARFAEQEYAAAAYRVFTDELTRSATTRACVFATVHRPATLLLMELMEKAGLRGFVGKLNMDSNCPDYLRFDFTHYEKISEEQLMEIEALVNRYITQGYAVTKEELPIEEAKKRNATALFDEKYGDIVRVVTMGDVSCEFCGGCHVDNTSQIGLCKIVSEESIGSGVRRITAKTGYAAYREFAANQQTLLNIAHTLKMNGITNVEEKVAQTAAELNAANKTCAQLKEQIFSLKANDLVHQLRPLGNGEVLIERMEGIDAKALKDIAANIKAQKENSVVFLATINQDKLVFVAGAGKGEHLMRWVYTYME